MAELRIASIGLEDEWSDERIDALSFRSTETILGYDVVLLRLTGLQYGYSSSLNGTYLGARDLSEDDSPRCRNDFDRRRRELGTLLEGGGTLVLFLHAPDHWYVDTGQRQTSGTGRNQRTTRIVEKCDLGSVLPFTISTTAAKTRQIELVAGEPFAAFWKAIGGKMGCAAYMGKPFGEATLQIRGTPNIVACLARAKLGTVVVLPQDPFFDETPAPRRQSKNRTQGRGGALTPTLFVDALTALVRELRADRGEYSIPEWAKALMVPGELGLTSAVREAEERARKALTEIDLEKAKLQTLQHRKLLLTGTGKALEEVVDEALVVLGFDVKPGSPNRTDRIARHPTLGVAVVEAKGKGKSAAERDCAQLEKWVTEHHLAHDEKPKGILVINAWRELPLKERLEVAFPEQMLPYAEGREHCLVTGTQLLCAWLDAEQNPTRAIEIARELFKCKGRFEGYDDVSSWITEVTESGVTAQVKNDKKTT